MDAVRKDVRRLVNKELEAANKRFPQFASPHEGQNVVREELEEAERAIQSHSGSRSKSGCRSNSGGSNGEEV